MVKNKFPLDLSKFKKIASDKNTTTLQHPAGHTIKIAHNALSPKLRGQLHAMPHFDDGGSVTPDTPTSNYQSIIGGNVPTDYDWKKTHRTQSYADKTAAASQGASSGDDSVSKAASWVKGKLGLAEGGDVKRQHLDQGGSSGNPMSSLMSLAPLALMALNKGGVANYDDGTTNVSPDDANKPVSININNTTPDPVNLPSSADWSDIDQGSANQQAAQAPQPDQNPTPPQQQSANASQILPPGPNSANGLNTEIAGYNNLGKAQAQEAQAQIPIYNQQASSQAAMQMEFQRHKDILDDEIENATIDAKNSHIDPDKYWDNHSKLMGTIGIILGGIAGGGKSNMALDYVNKQIDNNIAAQQAEMNQKNNILGFYYKQFGNMVDATNMTKGFLNDWVANKINLAATKAGTPMAMAQAQIHTGPLIQQRDALTNQIAMRQALMQGGVKNIDPAQVVPYMVPAEHQKDVLNEIGKAQNATQNEQQIMEQFDKAAQENTIANRVGHLGFNPGSVLQLNALSLPMIHDAEGRINEFEAKTLHDLTPAPFDSPEKVAAKRQGYLNFIHSKQAAPMAKSYGINLQQFQSTSGNPVDRMPPQQRAIVEWAKRNPNDPRSAIALKKLGVQ